MRSLHSFISIVHCTQSDQSIVNYFEDQRYPSFKSKNVDSKYEQNISCAVKGAKKIHANIYFQICKENGASKGKKEVTKCYYEREKAIQNLNQRKKEK